MTSKQRVLTIKNFCYRFIFSFLLWSSQIHEPKAPMRQRSDAFYSHNCHQFHLQAPTFEIRLNVVKCRRFFKNGKKIISSEFIKKLIIATFIPGTKYSEENLFCLEINRKGKGKKILHRYGF